MTSETVHPALTELLGTTISSIEKGVPSDFRLSEAGNQNWNLLQEDLPFPIAVLKQSCLEENGNSQAPLTSSSRPMERQP